MAKGLSPTQRTLAALRDQGCPCAITEKRNVYAGPLIPVERGGDGKRHVGVMQDLFGFIDIIALAGVRGIVGVQCTSGANHGARRDKIILETTEAATAWLRSGGRIEIWSWSKRKVTLSRGGKVDRWIPRVEEITLAHFQGEDDGDSDPSS